MKDFEHDYPIQVASRRIRFLLSKLDSPHLNREVVEYLNKEKRMSCREIASALDGNRRAIQRAETDWDDFSWERVGHGRKYERDPQQSGFDDFESTGLENFI